MKISYIIYVAGCVILSFSCRPTAQNSMNPFLKPYDTPFGVPPFDQIADSDYMPAFEAGIREQSDEIDAIVRSRKKPAFDNVIVALDRSGQLLRSVTMVFNGVNNANTSEELQAIDREITPMLAQHHDDIYLNAGLFAKVKTVYDQKDVLMLNDEQSRLLQETYKHFVRSGADLPPDQQAMLRELNRDISVLQVAFGQHLLAETNSYQLWVADEKRLSGLPEAQKEAAATAARAAGKTGRLFTLHHPSVMPFLQFADDRELRRQILEAYLHRGNNNNENDNKEIVARLVAKRLEKAKLLRYINYADYALDDRMAKTSENVYRLLRQIWRPALAKAREEAAEMRQLMRLHDRETELEAWDWRYYSEKVLKNKYDLNEETLRPYFRLENVRDGIFYVCNRLYGISFVEAPGLPKYHDEVDTYECKDADGTHLGILYTDFFPRPGKRGGAWCGSYRKQTCENERRVSGITHIVCNFTRPTGDTPALLSLDETETFFHEFGHALHNLFSDVHYYGTSNVPRDFVELPSQIMEHWAFRPEVLKHYAKHYLTGEIIPDELVRKMEQSSKHGQGFTTVEYLAAAFLDMDYHVLTSADHIDVTEFEKAAMDRIGLIGQIPPRYRSTFFNHAMGGGYTAGYYSYIWSEVLDADAFQAFAETGDIFDRTIAGAFRRHILSKGGIYDAMDMYVKFRGAAPRIDALLNNRGLKIEN